MPLTTPPTLRDLSSVSPEGLRARAAIWRDNMHHDPDDAIKSLLLAAASDLESAATSFATLASADASTLATDRTAATAIVDGTKISSDPDVLDAAAAMLRIRGVPDDGGSTADHLEKAALRIARDVAILSELRTVLEAPAFDAEAVLRIASAATDPGLAPATPGFKS